MQAIKRPAAAQQAGNKKVFLLLYFILGFYFRFFILGFFIFENKELFFISLAQALPKNSEQFSGEVNWCQVNSKNNFLFSFLSSTPRWLFRVIWCGVDYY